MQLYDLSLFSDKNESIKKIFYSKDHRLKINLQPTGILEGHITQYPNQFELSIPFNGLYITTEQCVKLAFITEWSNPNLDGKVSLAYTGVLMKDSDKNEFLVLRWLKSEDAFGVFETNEHQIDIFFSDPDGHLENKRHKIVGHIPFETLEQ